MAAASPNGDGFRCLFPPTHHVKHETLSVKEKMCGHISDMVQTCKNATILTNIRWVSAGTGVKIIN